MHAIKLLPFCSLVPSDKTCVPSVVLVKDDSWVGINGVISGINVAEEGIKEEIIRIYGAMTACAVGYINTPLPPRFPLNYLPCVEQHSTPTPTCFFSYPHHVSHTAQEGVNVAFDWRIRVQPPLVLHNTLPVGAQYVVWERPAAGGGLGAAGMGRSSSAGGRGGVLRACAWGRMDAWGHAQVYTADMRQQVRAWHGLLGTRP